MSLRPLELAQVVRELRERLLGASVQKAWVPEPRLCFLELRQVGRSSLLCVSAQRESARVSIAQARPPSPEHAASFQHAVRQGLVGAKLTAIESPHPHVARLRFERELTAYSLITNFQRGLERLYLVGADERLLAFDGSPGPDLRPGLPMPATLVEFEPNVEALSRLQPDEGAAFPFAEAAERLSGGRERERRSDAIRKQLLGPLRARLTRNARTLVKVAAEANRQSAAEEHRRFGELITRNAFALPRGASSARLTEYTESGPREVEVPLDPKRGPKDQAEWHFGQYKRLLRGCELADRRRVDLEREQQDLRNKMDAIESLSEAEVIERASPALSRAHRSVAKPYKEFASGAGERIWVGKNSASNDQLTFRVARPQDLWLHARGVAGSHVLVPLERNAQLPQELLIDAAHLALHHSEAKDEPRGEVSYTYAKFVKKQKGGAPGQVSYTREKTFSVRIESERLTRLLKTRNADG